MEYNLRTAIAEMKKQEETGINYIYAKTYNYVYLRAKSILKRENDVQQLMCEVYLKMLASSAEIEVENLYEWLGKCVYTLGCGYYRKKMSREAYDLEIEENEFAPRKIVSPEATADVIAKSLEELPDLYQAVFYAFYYDYMGIEMIAGLMGCTEGVIVNCLNYTRKYMIKALENYQEEKQAEVFFSVEAVCMSLRKWSVDHCLSITVAQSVYTEICKNANVKPAPIYMEGKEFAGVNNTVVYHKADDFVFLKEQAEKYKKKQRPDKKVLGLVAGIAVLVVVIVLAVFLFAGSGSDKKKDKKEPDKVENQQEDENDKSDEPVQVDEDANNDDGAAKNDDDARENDTTKVDASEYIFPESNTRALTREEVEAHSKAELRLARNEIYARHGMIFGGDLAEYFSGKSWYKPTIELEEFYDRVEMSLIEEGNVELIQEVEAAK